MFRSPAFGFPIVLSALLFGCAGQGPSREGATGARSPAPGDKVSLRVEMKDDGEWDTVVWGDGMVQEGDGSLSRRHGYRSEAVHRIWGLALEVARTVPPGRYRSGEDEEEVCTVTIDVGGKSGRYVLGSDRTSPQAPEKLGSLCGALYGMYAW